MATFSENDILLLGYDKASVVDNSSPEFVIFEGIARGGMRTYSDYFVYLRSNATVKGLEHVSKVRKFTDKFYVIKPRSLKLKLDTIVGVLGSQAEIHDFEDLSWKTVRGKFSSYINQLRVELPEERHFVSPHCVDDIHRKLDEIVVAFLSKSISDKEKNLKVLIADAGVGKTTLARHVVHALINGIDRYKVIPVYVEASHWSKIQLDALDSFWELIENSLRIFDERISIPERVFRHILSLGQVAFVFDGFDELCIKKITNFSPETTIDSLVNLASDGKPKIIVTSRKVYWETVVASLPSSIEEIEIARFNKQMAHYYFNEYFKHNDKKLAQVKTLYSMLLETNKPKDSGGFNERIINLPLVLSMLAGMVEEGDAEKFFQGKIGILPAVLRAFCLREVERQKLSTSADKQLEALEEVALMGGDDFEMGMLEAAGFESDDIDRLKDHPLVDFFSGKCRLKYDFLYPYFKAHRVFTSLSGSDDPEDVFRIIKTEVLPGSLIQEHLFQYFNDNNISMMADLFPQARGEYVSAKSFIFHFVKSFVWRNYSSENTREKTLILAKLLNSNVDTKIFRDLLIYGQFSELDLSGLEIVSSRFVDVDISRLIVDENTVFRGCRFEGNITFNVAGIETVKAASFFDCHASAPASIVMSAVFQDSSESRADIVMESLVLAARKFWRNGRCKQTIEQNIWPKGQLGYSPLRDAIKEKFLKYKIMEEAEVSGVSEGCYRFNRDDIPDLQKLMDNRILAGNFKKIFDELFTHKE